MNDIYKDYADNLQILKTQAKQAGASAAMVSFLSTTMFAESGGHATVCSSSSTAKGLFQFIDGTWNSVCSRNGLDASKRFDPETQCAAAICLAKENAAALCPILGKSSPDELTAGELYLAHFLGESGAKRLFAADPSVLLSTIDPAAIAHNPRIKLANGKPIQDFTVADLRRWADAKMDVQMDQRFTYKARHDAKQTSPEEDAAEAAERKHILDELGIPKEMIHTFGLDKTDTLLGDIFFGILRMFMDDTGPKLHFSSVVCTGLNQNTIERPNLPSPPQHAQANPLPRH